MKPYSPAHIDYLRNNLPQHLSGSIQDALRIALAENDREDYLAVLERLKDFYCACELCELPTHQTGTKRCDFCWELESRIELKQRFKLWSATEEGRVALNRVAVILKRLFLERTPIIIGQPVVTTDGFGKVVSFERHPFLRIRVRNDIDNIERVWDAHNVQYVRFELSPFTQD